MQPDDDFRLGDTISYAKPFTAPDGTRWYNFAGAARIINHAKSDSGRSFILSVTTLGRWMRRGTTTSLWSLTLEILHVADPNRPSKDRLFLSERHAYMLRDVLRNRRAHDGSTFTHNELIKLKAETRHYRPRSRASRSAPTL